MQTAAADFPTLGGDSDEMVIFFWAQSPEIYQIIILQALETFTLVTPESFTETGLSFQTKARNC